MKKLYVNGQLVAVIFESPYTVETEDGSVSLQEYLLSTITSNLMYDNTVPFITTTEPAPMYLGVPLAEFTDRQLEVYDEIDKGTRDLEDLVELDETPFEWALGEARILCDLIRSNELLCAAQGIEPPSAPNKFITITTKAAQFPIKTAHDLYTLYTDWLSMEDDKRKLERKNNVHDMHTQVDFAWVANAEQIRDDYRKVFQALPSTAVFTLEEFEKFALQVLDK